MNTLLTTLEHVLAENLSHDKSLINRHSAMSALTILSGFLLCLGFGLLLYASYLWFLGMYSPEAAAGFTGALALVFALICAAAAYGFVLYQLIKLKKIRETITHALQTAIHVAEEELAEPVQKNPKAAVLAASLAGFMTGEKFL